MAAGHQACIVLNQGWNLFIALKAREPEDHGMIQMVEILDDELRVHIINVQHIVAVTGNRSGEGVLLLSTGREIKLHESEDFDVLLDKIQQPED